MHEPAHLLIVDDDASIRRMFQLLLQDAGYRVTTAGSGEEALAYLELISPDLVLLDLMLPGINGKDVARKIKADADRPFIPVILVTAQGDQQTKVNVLDAGADDYLVKPVEFAELLARVRAMLRLQRSQRSLRAEQRKTELLLHLTRELGTSLNLDHLLTRFLERLSDAVGAVRASILLPEYGPEGLFYSNTGYTPTRPISELVQHGTAGLVLRSGTPVVIADTEQDTRWLPTNEPFGGVRSVASVPVLREGKLYGVMTLVHHRPGYFTSEHLELLDSVAAQTAIALENAELFALTNTQKNLLARRADELQRLNQISQILSELMSPDQTLRLVTHLIHITFNYPLVSIWLRDQDMLTARAWSGGIGAQLAVGQQMSRQHGVLGWVMRQQEPLNVPDVTSDVRFVPLGPGDQTRSELTVPIMTARDVVGVLDVASSQPHAFDESDERLLQTLASQIGVALENARLFETEKRRVTQLARVNDLSVALTAQLDVQNSLQVAADALIAIFGVPRAGVFTVGGVGDALPMMALSSGWHADGLAIGVSHWLNPDTLQSPGVRSPRIMVRAAAADTLPFHGLLQAFGSDSLAIAPLLANGRHVGLLVLDATNRELLFGAAELSLLETVASLVAQVLENAALYRQVEDERSTLDAVLTSAADPILLIGPQDEVLLKNRAAADQLPMIDADDNRLESLIANTDLLAALRSDRAADTNEISLPDGATFSISVAPVHRSTDEMIGRVAVLQDITAIKQLERQEQERIRNVFRRYVSPDVAEEVLATSGDLGEPTERDVVVLFADLRNYTALTERLGPRVLVEQVLNRYFTAMTEVLYRHGGTIDKFLGDGIIGVFGWPIARTNDGDRALAAAIDLQLALADLRTTWERELGTSIGMGIGLDYGRAIVGNIGSEQRLDYTLIGDVVNTASRLSGLARPGQILVSYHLVDALDTARVQWSLVPVDRVSIKGKQQPHLIYDLEYAQPQIHPLGERWA